MLDPQLFRQHLDEVAQQLATRGFTLDKQRLADLEAERKRCQVETQTLQNQRNQLSKAIGQHKARGESTSALMQQVSEINQQLDSQQQYLSHIQTQLEHLLLEIPNIPHSSVPIGHNQNDNLEIRRWGKPSAWHFQAQDHVDLGTQLKVLALDTATKITGSRFSLMWGALARLHRALIQFMLDLHTQQHGYTEVYVPYLVNSDSLLATGQLPKFAEDLFYISDYHYYLIPTAEVPVTNIVRDTIVTELPLKMVAHTPCFRSEAGNYGKDTRGMIRQHQFEKVELVQMVEPEHSYTALEELTAHAETVLQQLALPYRVVSLCSGDLGFSAAKTYDLEVWLPGQQQYREISSCSNFEAFQARRMQARWRQPQVKKPVLLHTLNGSGLAVGRTLVAIMENYQDENGRIAIPQALHTYMGGQTHIQEHNP